jgi:hypothetical protein
MNIRITIPKNLAISGIVDSWFVDVTLGGPTFPLEPRASVPRSNGRLARRLQAVVSGPRDPITTHRIRN